MIKNIKFITATFQIMAILANEPITIYAAEKNDSFDLEYFNTLSPINDFDMSDLAMYSINEFANNPIEHVNQHINDAQGQKTNSELPVKKRKVSTSRKVTSKLSKEQLASERATRLKNRNTNKENILKENGCYTQPSHEILPKTSRVLEPQIMGRILQPVNTNSTPLPDYFGENQEDSYLSYMPDKNQSFADLLQLHTQEAQSTEPKFNLDLDSDDLFSTLANW